MDGSELSKDAEQAEAMALPRASERQRGIDRVVDLLEALLRHRTPARIGDIARSIQAPRSTTYELVNRLIRAEILEPVGEDGHVYFGKAVYHYGRAYADANPFHRRCRHVLERLSAETAATTQLCALKGNKYIVVDACMGPGLFRITADIGVEVPVPWTASGRLLLGHMDGEAVRCFIPAEDFRLPDGRLLSVDDFLADIVAAREQGTCVTVGLADRFTCCLAAPIRDRHGIVVATLCFVVPADADEARRADLLARLVTAAQTLSPYG